ncbi:MAG: hypothetical protein JST00_31445 [Deltaproteobacteria bacterium]|nr:hypothetical protein [Deltaproteobacteria bacterium]
MSYDLSLFRARSPGQASAAEIHGALCRGGVPDGVEEAPKAIDSAYRAIVSQYPELDDDEESSPWSAALTKTPYGLVMPMTFSMAGAVRPVVFAVAQAWGLTVYDPQDGRAYGPDDERPPAEEKRLATKEAEKELAERIREAAAGHGFLPPKKRQKNATFVRTTKAGLTQSFTLVRANAKEVRILFAIDDAALSQPIAEAVGDGKPLRLVDTELIAPFREDDGTITKATKIPDSGYAICHRSCLERNVVAMTRDLETFAWPLFERASTLEGVEELYHGAGFTLRPAYLQLAVRKTPAFPFVGIALARRVRRSDLDRWMDYYREWIGKWGSPDLRERNLALFDAFAKGPRPGPRDD